MKIDTKKIDRGRIELTIELSPAEYEPFLRRAAETISQQTSIPGFRPGKASFDVVAQRVGAAKLWEEALEPAIRRTLVQALAQEKLVTVGAPKVEVTKLAPGNPVVYQATLGLLPAVTLADYKSIKVKAQPVTVSDEVVKKSLNDLQKMHATEVLVKRPAKNGDKVEIDFALFQDNIPVDKGGQTKLPLVIGEGTFIPGFEDQLIGLAADQTKEFTLTFPANYGQKQLAGKPGDFKVTMRSVYELTLPKLDDEFAKMLGGFKTMAELETKVRENLKTEAEHKEQQRLEEAMFDQLLGKSSFEDIPDILIDSEAKKMLEELEHNLEHQGLKFDDYLNHLKKTRADLLLDFAPQAIRRVKSALASRAIAEKENLLATEAEINGEVTKTLDAYGHDPEIKKQIETSDYRAYIGNVLTGRKVIEHLRSIMVQ